VLKNGGIRIVESRLTLSVSVVLLDYLLLRFPYHDEAEWRHRIDSGELQCNGRTASAGTMLQNGDLLRYTPQKLQEPPVDFHYRIVHETEQFYVIDKSGNLPCHPAGPYFEHTLWYDLQKRGSEVHFVNRLDRETSGLLLAAKTPETAAFLAKNILQKKYLALAAGEWDFEQEVKGFLFRDPASGIRKKRIFSPEKPEGVKSETAVTFFRTRETRDGLTLVEAELRGTGRTHQIRATLLYLGHPLAGDKLYGPDETLYRRQKNGVLSEEDLARLRFPRQALHSAEIAFRAPENGEILHFFSVFPSFR